MNDNIKYTTEIFRILSNPKKLNLALFLNEKGEMSVNDICKNVSCEQSLISHNLRDMKKYHILDSKKEGRNVYYFIKNKCILDAINCILKNYKTI